MTSFAVMKNVLRRILRDVRTLALIVILPLFFVLLYGNTFSGSYSHLKIVVVNAGILPLASATNSSRAARAMPSATAATGGLNKLMIAAR